MMHKHQENLQKLCRLCGGYICKDAVDVLKCQEKIKNAFFIDISNDSDLIEPRKICKVCYATLLTVENRQTTTNLKPVSWEHHNNNNCATCSRVETIKKGGRKPKKAKLGRPKSNEQIWSRAVLNKIINIIPKTEIDYSKFKRTDFKPELNQHLDLCTCKLCGDLLQTPLMFTKCEHSFCLKCITQMVEGKNISTTKCPTCLVKINDVNDLIPSKQIYNLLDCLAMECIKNCGKTFKIKDHTKEQHELQCSTKNQETYVSNTTLQDIFSIDAESDISRDMEDAALHIIRQKMAKTASTTIEFKSGGPRVSLHLRLNMYYF